MSLFALLALMQYRRCCFTPSPSIGHLVSVVVLSALAMFSKEQGVTILVNI
jgi:hypothetical protein